MSEHVIWKHMLGYGENPAYMPKCAEVLKVDLQNGIPTIWFRSDPNGTLITRNFRIVGTGQAFSSDLIYHGTFLDGSFVWHVMEKPQK